jgi:signal transduction histidine kinase
MRWQRWADVALVAGCVALTVLAVKAHWSPLPRPVIAVAGLAGSAAQWQRRRWPMTAALAGSAAYALSGNPGPLLVGLYAGGSYGRRRRAWLPALAGWAGITAAFGIDAGRLRADDVAWAALGSALTVAVGRYAATRRDLTEAWRERAENAGERARSAERNRIAREMHDVVAHKVSLIALHAGALELTAGGSQTQVAQQAALIRTTAREALRDLRDVLGLLQDGPAVLDHGEPYPDLVSLVEAARRAGQDVELRDEAETLSPATARVAYRIAQEGLTNARKHAPGAPASVSVELGSAGAVTVTVLNAPSVSEPMDLPGSGAGLIGLAERVRLAGGALHSGRTEDGGWRLRAVLPPAATGDDR